MADVVHLPQKKYYRQRAHSNPLADHTFSYPVCPADMDWRALYPAWEEGKAVRFLDVGCGYGGHLVKLSELYPDNLVLGLEIRVKVSDYVQDRLKALRLNHPGRYDNVAVLRTNAMKYLPNYFVKGQLEKMFFLFPDPHFKKNKHKWRIVNTSILAEYAYVMREGGVVYTATDVEELHRWMVDHFTMFPLFQRLTDEDPVVPLLSQCTEEGKKVQRSGGRVFVACFTRVSDPHSQRENTVRSFQLK